MSACTSAPAFPRPRSARRWLLAAVLLVTGVSSYSWSADSLRPEERRILGTWESPELSWGSPSEAIEFQEDRSTTSFWSPWTSHHGFGDGVLLLQSGTSRNWRRRGNFITINQQHPELGLLERLEQIADSLWKDGSWPQDTTLLKVIQESPDELIIEDSRRQSRRIHFRRLIATELPPLTPDVWPSHPNGSGGISYPTYGPTRSIMVQRATGGSGKNAP